MEVRSAMLGSGGQTRLSGPARPRAFTHQENANVRRRSGGSGRGQVLRFRDSRRRKPTAAHPGGDQAILRTLPTKSRNDHVGVRSKNTVLSAAMPEMRKHRIEYEISSARTHALVGAEDRRARARGTGRQLQGSMRSNGGFAKTYFDETY